MLTDKWKTILENVDGSINKEQLSRELHDYDALYDKIAGLLDEWTGGQTANPWVVDKQLKEAHDNVFIRKGDAHDDLLMILDLDEDQAKALREYLDQ